MSQTLMEQLVKYEKACCVYSYFKQHEHLTSLVLAAHLGVTPHTVRSWRKRITQGDVTCGYGATGYHGCLFRAPHTRKTPV